MDHFETSLQVLRGFWFDITSKVNYIKVSTCLLSSGLSTNLCEVHSSESPVFSLTSATKTDQLQRLGLPHFKKKTKTDQLNQEKLCMPLIVTS
jgi:hypothetical protein